MIGRQKFFFFCAYLLLSLLTPLFLPFTFVSLSYFILQFPCQRYTVSDAIVCSWLGLTATTSSILGYFSILLQAVDNDPSFCVSRFSTGRLLEDFTFLLFHANNFWTKCCLWLVEKFYLKQILIYPIKGFGEIKKNIEEMSLSSIELLISSVTFTNTFYLELLLLWACWLSFAKLFFSMYSVNWIEMTFYNLFSIPWRQWMKYKCRRLASAFIHYFWE